MFFLRSVVKNNFLQGCIYIHPSFSNKSIVSNFVFTLQPGHQCTGQRIISGIACMRERTLIAVKPDGVQRCLVGKIIQRFEEKGFKLVGLKMLQASENVICQHYHELRRTSFYPSLLHYMTSGPVVVMVWEGHNVVRASRLMVGRTDPAEVQAGTIRGDFCIHISRNVIHASDSVERAQREIELWFQGKELLDLEFCDHSGTYEL